MIVDLTVKFAKENPTWGYDRISGAFSNVGYNICDSTIGNILKAHGIEPAPDRKRTGSWETFLNAHWDVMASIDFTTVEVWTKGGLTTFYLLFVMELKTRRVNFAGCTTNPNEAWMKTIARELTNHEDGFLKNKKYLMMDRDVTRFCLTFWPASLCLNSISTENWAAVDYAISQFIGQSARSTFLTPRDRKISIPKRYTS